MRYALFFLLGLVVGAVLAVPGMIFFLRSDAGLSVLRSYVAPQPAWPDITVAQAASTTEITNKLAAGSILIGVPKLYATAEYSAAFNGSLREIALIATSSERLVGILSTINAKSIAREYNGLFDLVAAAKNIITQQKAATARFSQDLTALAAANQQTPDVQTKALTQDLVGKGRTFHGALEAYIASVDAVLSGSIPSAKQIADLNANVESAGIKGTDFSNAVKALTARFSGAAGKVQ